ncbi:hypothetical protein Shyhy01_25000 [Streptomyces hygroscopicus subsp. hygroscopicus]|nr:hypothetical protein [Streptomyces hygroscopicus]GLX49550.1 hypothetical protein Shyhy01_25000 [Streptomyces hygroscopicus subsp. hygroscopicus]
MRLSTATIVPLLAVGVAFTGAAPAMADPQPGPPPPVSSPVPQPGTDSGSDNGFGFGNVRPGHGFGDRNHTHVFRLHRQHRFEEECFFVHRHVVVRIFRHDDRVVIIKTVVPGHLVCITPFRDF